MLLGNMNDYIKQMSAGGQAQPQSPDWQAQAAANVGGTVPGAGRQSPQAAALANFLPGVMPPVNQEKLVGMYNPKPVSTYLDQLQQPNPVAQQQVAGNLNNNNAQGIQTALQSFTKQQGPEMSVGQRYQNMLGSIQGKQRFVDTIENAGGDPAQAKNLLKILGRLHGSPMGKQLSGDIVATPQRFGNNIANVGYGFMMNLLSDTSQGHLSSLTSDPDWAEILEKLAQTKNPLDIAERIGNMVLDNYNKLGI